MPMEVYGDTDGLSIKAFSSPVVEFICVIRVLTDIVDSQDQHIEKKWANEILARLSDESLVVLNILKQFAWKSMELLNFVYVINEHQDINNFIVQLQQLDILDFYYYILNEEIDRSIISQAFSDKKYILKIQKEVKWTIEKDIIIKLFENSVEIKNKIIALLNDIHNNGFANRYEKCISKMEDGLKYINDLIGKDRIDVLLEKITGKSKSIFAGFKEYYIISSYFIPFQFLRFYSDEKLYIVFDCRVGMEKQEAITDNLSSMLKMIDDKSRMEILRILMYNKSYGKAISESIGISTPTVSHHLDLLKQAGLVKEEKVKNIKYFYTDKEKLKNTIDDLNKFFFSVE